MIKRALPGLLSLLCAAVLWCPSVHLLFQPSELPKREGPLSKIAQQLMKRHLRIWTDPELQRLELEKMQGLNPEWDFMSRTYFVLALANIALRDKAQRTEALQIMDLIIEATLEVEEERGISHFLLPYGRQGGWLLQPHRSQFVDGEIALMLGARRLVEERPEWTAPLQERVELMIARMKQSPVLCAESYPDECWTFCNSVSLAAIKIADLLDGSDHTDFIKRWLKVAQARLTEPQTGLLISSYRLDGTPLPSGFGPEGSSIWMSSHMLQIIDIEYARDQYRRAAKELGRSVLGFGYALEWPRCCPGEMDVDSGPIIPGLQASAGSSGLALLGASAFGDRGYLKQLMSALNLLAFPVEDEDGLRYLASNPVGDAVILYSMVQGPLWREVQRRDAYGR